MSDTPRTDEFAAEAGYYGKDEQVVFADFARQLERELAAAMAEAARLSAANVGLANESARLFCIIDNLVIAWDGMDSVDSSDEEYAPALAAMDKAVEAARPFTEKAMLAIAEGGR